MSCCGYVLPPFPLIIPLDKVPSIPLISPLLAVAEVIGASSTSSRRIAKAASVSKTAASIHVLDGVFQKQCNGAKAHAQQDYMQHLDNNVLGGCMMLHGVSTGLN